MYTRVVLTGLFAAVIANWCGDLLQDPAAAPPEDIIGSAFSQMMLATAVSSIASDTTTILHAITGDEIQIPRSEFQRHITRNT